MSFGDERYREIKLNLAKRGYRYQLSFYSRYVKLDEEKPIRVEVMSQLPFTKEDIQFIFSTIKKAPPPMSLTLMVWDPRTKLLDIVWSGD